MSSVLVTRPQHEDRKFVFDPSPMGPGAQAFSNDDVTKRNISSNTTTNRTIKVSENTTIPKTINYFEMSSVLLVKALPPHIKITLNKIHS
jgi:hypothetical protein